MENEKHTVITVHTSDTSYRVAPKSEKVFRKELDAIQQRCTVRTIDADDLFKMIVVYEKSLAHFLSYKDMKGASVEIDLNAQTFPNAYKYTPRSTVVKIECSAPRSWTILSIKRDITQKDIYECKKFTDLQKAQILESAIKSI